MPLLLSQLDPLKIFDTALTNSEKITFAVLAFAVIVLMVILVIFMFRWLGSNNQERKQNYQREERQDRTNSALDKIVDRLEGMQDTAVQMAGIMKTMQDDFLKGIKDLPTQVASPIMASISEVVPQTIQKELGNLQRIITENPLHVGVMSVGATGRIMAVNQDALKLFGWKPNEILGRFVFATDLSVIGPDQQRIPPPAYSTSICFYSKAAINNRLVGVYNKEKSSWVWVIVSAEPSFNPTTGALERILTSFIEAGRVVPFDPNADYAVSLADTAEIKAITPAELEAAK